MKTFLSLLVLGLIPSLSNACKLPPDREIRVGCSYDCDFFYRFRISNVARNLGYPVSFIDLRSSSEEADAILIPGGADIDPSFYLDSITPELAEYTRANLHLVDFTQEGRERDPFEYRLLKRYSSEERFAQTPLLGICRGMQMMSVAQGIPLYLDIQSELGIKNRRNRFDRIIIDQNVNSRMRTSHLNESVLGFKLHHQGLRVAYYDEYRSRYPQTRVTARSNRGLIAEALEYTHRPALGVQYHPEKSSTNTAAPVFSWFLKASCEAINQKEGL